MNDSVLRDHGYMLFCTIRAYTNETFILRPRTYVKVPIP